jgi:protein O-GlcNAc transferase
MRPAEHSTRMLDVTPAFAGAFKHATGLYRAGKLDQAEVLCEAIARARADHFDALHLLAIVQSRLGRAQAALASYDRALAERPDDAEALYNRGITLTHLRRFEEALASYDRAIACRPDFVAALVNRGIALHELGRFDDALASYDRALALQPDHAEALCNRGMALHGLQRFEDALPSHDRAVALRPDFVPALLNRGLTLREMRRFAEALASCDRALAIRPDHAEALSLRAITLCDLERFEEALATCDQALAPTPDDAAMLFCRGNALRALQCHEEALASYDRVLAIRPDHVEALNNRGLVLWELKRCEEALASCDEVLALRPDHVEALNNRGLALCDLSRFADALTSYDQALASAPDHVATLHNRGLVLLKLDRHQDAIADFERVRRIDTAFPYLDGLLLHARMLCCDWRSFAPDLARLTERVRAGKRASGPFAMLGLSPSARDQLACAQTWVRDRRPASAIPVWKGERYRHDRIRVAYLSADLHDHPVSYLMAGVFERHDRTRFETTAVSFGRDHASEMRMRLKGAFDRFLDVQNEGDRDVASRLRDLEIDIAVDLMGFTRDARTGILALRPAPVQVNYIGYPATMGADYVDYIIADRFVIPAQSQDLYAEKVVYLPETFQANDSARRIADGMADRAAAGLPDRGFVFCSLSNSYKITPPVFDVWMRLVGAVDSSVLWLFGSNPAVERNLRHEAERRGVAPDRLVFAPKIPYAEHLARYRLADLFLDTLPYNAGTTASDALWAGLPVVTVPGEAFASRMAASLLLSACLPELVTHSLADYEALALGLAQDAQLLAAVKTKLAQRRATSPLFDTDRFRRHLEAAYTTMWQRFQRGEAPASFAVEPLGPVSS